MYLPTVTIPLPTYYDCAWIFSVEADGETPCVLCPHRFTEITNGNDSDITADNYCDMVANFGSEEPSCPPHGNSTCIQRHEDAHYIDWLDALQAEQTVFAGDPSISDMAIDCDDSDTTTCQAAKSARQSAIETAVEQAWCNAADAWNAMGETNAIAAAADCHSDLVDSICAVWDCNDCN